MFLLPMLFKGFLCCGASVLALQVLEPRHPAAEEPLSFRILQISSFANHSWVCTHGSGWLGELQTHSWDNVLGTIRFLLPWAQGNFSKEELKNIQAFLKLYFHSFPQEVQAFSSQLQFEYPFELQLSLGCLSRPVKASESFFNGAYQGSDFLSFQGNSWTPSLGAGSQAQNACTVLNHYRVIKEIVEVALYDICPRFLAGLLQAGKSELERQVKPEAWLSKGPSPGPGRLLLICHISGFHPKPVWVMWMRGEQEQQATQRGDILPHADGTWYLRVTLDVAAGEATGLSCRVKHSSLGGHDIILYWGGISIVPTLICLMVVVTLVLLVVVDSLFKKQRKSFLAAFLQLLINTFFFPPFSFSFPFLSDFPYLKSRSSSSPSAQIGTSSLLMSPTMTFPLELTPKTPGTQDLSSAWHKICGSKTDS